MTAMARTYVAQTMPNEWDQRQPVWSWQAGQKTGGRAASTHCVSASSTIVDARINYKNISRMNKKSLSIYLNKVTVKLTGLIK